MPEIYKGLEGAGSFHARALDRLLQHCHRLLVGTRLKKLATVNPGERLWPASGNQFLFVGPRYAPLLAAVVMQHGVASFDAAHTESPIPRPPALHREPARSGEARREGELMRLPPRGCAHRCIESPALP